MIELAGCIIPNALGQLLVAHRNTPELTQYEIIGGKVNGREAMHRAAAREVFEESGVHVAVVRKLGTFIFEHADTTYRYHYFLGRFDEGTPRVLEPHIHDEVAWHDPHELRLKEPLSQPLQHVLDLIITGDMPLSGNYPQDAV